MHAAMQTPVSFLLRLTYSVILYQLKNHIALNETVNSARDFSVSMCISNPMVSGNAYYTVRNQLPGTAKSRSSGSALFVFGMYWLRNLSRDIGSLDYGSSWIFSVPSREGWYNTSIRPWRLCSKSFPVPQPSYPPTLDSLDTDSAAKERTLKTLTWILPLRVLRQGQRLCFLSRALLGTAVGRKTLVKTMKPAHKHRAQLGPVNSWACWTVQIFICRDLRISSDSSSLLCLLLYS